LLQSVYFDVGIGKTDYRKVAWCCKAGVMCSTEYGRTCLYVAAVFVLPRVGSNLASFIRPSSPTRSSTGYS